MVLKIGDWICDKTGRKFEVGQIIYADIGIGDVEFLDPKGNYHHWKQYFDGGKIISKNS